MKQTVIYLVFLFWEKTENKEFSCNALQISCKTHIIIVPVNRGDDYMANNTTNISIRMDSKLKKQADALFEELGMNITTAFNIFVRQTLREGRIPFDISINTPNKKTVTAMLEAERIAKDSSIKGYEDVEELLADLKK